MRTVQLTLGVFSLLWGFLQAPFDHIHPAEVEHHAASGLAHIHVHEAVTEHDIHIGSHEDEDDIDVQWNVTTTAHIAFYADTTLTERLSVPVPAFTSTAILVPRHRGHDPPESSPKIPRAPPA